MLVWVASYQRSGNNLTFRTLDEVFGSNRFCTIYKPGLFLRGKKFSRYKVPPELRKKPKDELLETLRARPEPFFIKSHRPRDSSDPAPGLYIVRDGRDVLVSRAHWLGDNKIGPYHELPFEQQLRRLVSSENWSKHIRTWRTRSAPTALVRYEDLLEDAAGTVQRACDQIGVSLGDPKGELTPFAELRERDPLMHRRGKTGSWEEEMPPELEETFWQLHGEEMEALGYTNRGAGRGEAKVGTGARVS